MEINYPESSMKSIRSLNINIEDDAISECDFSGCSSIMMEKYPSYRLDAFDLCGRGGKLDPEKLMIPVESVDDEVEPQSGTTNTSKRKLFYDI